MDSSARKYFFSPRVGEHYDSGFCGCRTLVVGAHHYCDLKQCPCYTKCVEEKLCADFDKLCPHNQSLLKTLGADSDDYYDLSNSNAIELDGYISGCAYPAYSAFTKYMLCKSDYLEESEKAYFWDRVAFYNYTQHFLPNGYTPSYNADKNLFDADFEAFESVLASLNPDVVYVWNPAVRDCICSKSEVLDYKGRTDMQGLSVYVFASKNQPAVDAEKVMAESGKNDASQVLNCLNDLRQRQYSDCDEVSRDILGKYAWNRDVLCSLTDMKLKEESMLVSGLQGLGEKVFKGIGRGSDVYSNFYWRELEEKMECRIWPISNFPPFELAMFDARLDREIEERSAVAVIYLKETCVFLGSRVNEIIESGKYRTLIFFSSNKNMPSYKRVFDKRGNGFGLTYTDSFGKISVAKIEFDKTSRLKKNVGSKEVAQFGELDAFNKSNGTKMHKGTCYDNVKRILGENFKLGSTFIYKDGNNKNHDIESFADILLYSIDFMTCLEDGFKPNIPIKDFDYYLKKLFELISPDTQDSGKSKRKSKPHKSLTVENQRLLFQSKSIGRTSHKTGDDNENTKKIDAFFKKFTPKASR